MSERTLVRSGETEFFVEVAGKSGVGTVGLDDVLSFSGVRDTISAIGAELAAAWEAAKPDEATVEFGLDVAVKSGKLTGLLVEGSGAASLKVSLTWSRSPASQ